MTPPIIASIFHTKGEIGDFSWMIQQDLYKDVLFIFNDSIEFTNSYKRGNGNAWIRAHTINNPEETRPQAANIPVSSIRTGGFSALDTKTQNYIDESIQKIQTIINNHVYETIYFAAESDNKIATNNYVVASSVRDYITSAIHSLT